MSPEMRKRVEKSIEDLKEPESFDEAELLFIKIEAEQRAHKFNKISSAYGFYDGIATKAVEMLKRLKK